MFISLTKDVECIVGLQLQGRLAAHDGEQVQEVLEAQVRVLERREDAGDALSEGVVLREEEEECEEGDRNVEMKQCEEEK